MAIPWLLTPGRCSPLSMVPLLIDFTTPSSLLHEQDRRSALPIVGNGPPGTFVLFPDRIKVSLPTDQIICADDAGGHAQVGFGGMSFVGQEGTELVFVRIRELFPEDQLSPDRSHTMRLDVQRVDSVRVEGRAVHDGAARPDGRTSRAYRVY